MMEQTALISTRDLGFSYQNGAQALKDVTLDLRKDRKVVLLGPNGAGKSTLFLHFNGILRPKAGEVRFEGTPLRYDQRSLAALRAQVAIVLQNPDDQIFSTTVEEDVAFGPLNLQLEREEVERRVDESLHLVGMEGLRQRPTQQLSFGQRKRVSLAGALAMRPKVLIMDEPTAGLDSEMVHELMELSDELNHQGMTMIMSTHDIEIAYEWADEAVVMNHGEIMFKGTPEDLFDQHDLIDQLRIVPPYLVRVNQQSHYRTGRPERPFPRNLVELSHKCFPLVNPSIDLSTRTGRGENEKRGTLFLVDVDDPDHPEQAMRLGERIPDMHYRSGAYGARSRRRAREGRIDVHHSFHALEDAILQVSLGRDYVLYTDHALMSLVISEISKMENRMGLRIHVVPARSEGDGTTRHCSVVLGDEGGEP